MQCCSRYADCFFCLFRNKPDGTSACNCWWKIQTIWEVHPLKALTNSLDLLFAFLPSQTLLKGHPLTTTYIDSVHLTWYLVFPCFLLIACSNIFFFAFYVLFRSWHIFILTSTNRDWGGTWYLSENILDLLMNLFNYDITRILGSPGYYVIYVIVFDMLKLCF